MVNTFEEFFVADNPSNRTAEEVTPTIVGREARRSVAAVADVTDITVGVRVVKASEVTASSVAVEIRTVVLIVDTVAYVEAFGVVEARRACAEAVLTQLITFVTGSDVDRMNIGKTVIVVSGILLSERVST